MKKSLLFSLKMLGQIGFAVAIPLVGFALLGRYLDRRFNTGHDFFFALFIFATILVFFIVRKIVLDAAKAFQDLNN